MLLCHKIGVYANPGFKYVYFIPSSFNKINSGYIAIQTNLKTDYCMAHYVARKTRTNVMAAIYGFLSTGTISVLHS